MNKLNSLSRHILASLILGGASSMALAQFSSIADMGSRQGDQAVFNFVGADIESVTSAIGKYIDKNFIIDPRVKGVLTMSPERALNKNQAYELLASTLRMQGFVLVPAGGNNVKVVPESEARMQASAMAGAGVRGDQIATQIFPLKNESAANLLPVLRPLISPNNSITANPGSNQLVVTDYAENLARIAGIIGRLDVSVIGSLDVIPVGNAVASDIAALANKLLDTGGGQGGTDGGRVMVMADPRTNSVIVRAPSTARAALAKTLIAKLDQPTALPGNVHVVYLRNADAGKLARTLRAIVSADASSLSTASSGRNGLTATANGVSSLQNGAPPGASLASPSGTASFQPVAGTGAGGDILPQGSASAGIIQADETTNTLIITASEPVYRNLRAVIDQLDTRRAQVYVEALIVEVTDTAASEIGVQWLALSGDSSSAYRVGGGTAFSGTNTGITSGNLFNAAIGSAANSSTVPTLGSGLQLGVFRQIAGKIGLGALASALNVTTGGNVLSMPNLITLDNEEARIVVGQNVPFVTGSYATTGGTTTNPFTTVDRKDVGTALRIKPHISEGGAVRLEISQEVSAVVPSTASNQNGPTTTKRSLDTTILVDDGDVIALGGLIGDDNQNNIQKVPLLGDLPVVGNLFKYQAGSRTKTNMMIFLRPTVVRNREQNDIIAMDRYDYIRNTQASVQPGKGTPADFGSNVAPRLEDGGPFIDLRARNRGTASAPTSSADMPAAPAAPAATASVNNTP